VIARVIVLTEIKRGQASVADMTNHGSNAGRGIDKDIHTRRGRSEIRNNLRRFCWRKKNEISKTSKDLPKMSLVLH
jgi:hypothetical protein